MANDWKLAGTYFEACNCDVSCTCVFLSPPTEDECSVLIAWHIDEGSFGDVELDGLNVAMAAYAPGHMLEGNWQAALYLDERASETQANALTQIFGGQAGGHPAALGSFISEVRGVRSVPIEYRTNGRARSLRIANVAEMDIAALEGQNGADVTLENLPFCVAPGYQTVVGKSTNLKYQDHGWQWEISEKAGLYSPFSYQGD
jgi:hypothetical protein